jgi:hypothetical protein
MPDIFRRLSAATKPTLSVLCAIALLGTDPAEAAGKSFKDRDWSFSMFDNCGLPITRGADASIAWSKIQRDKKLRVSLRPGDVGKCSTDAKARNHAPFWERAELRQKGYLKPGRHHRVEFEATLLEGFVGERENFFQIHGWNGECHAAPPVMVRFHRGKLEVRALYQTSGNGLGSGRGEHRSVQRASVTSRSLIGKPAKFTIDFDYRQNPARLTVDVNGTQVVSGAKVEYAPCAKPYIKMGIYRPGKGKATSRILFDDISLTSSK